MLSSISNCHQVQKSGMLIIMSLLDIIAPGDVCIVWLPAHLEACTTVANTLSVIFVVSDSLCVGSTCSITRSISTIVLCNRSTIAFNYGIFAVVGFEVIPRLLIIS